MRFILKSSPQVIQHLVNFWESGRTPPQKFYMLWRVIFIHEVVTLSFFLHSKFSTKGFPCWPLRHFKDVGGGLLRQFLKGFEYIFTTPPNEFWHLEISKDGSNSLHSRYIYQICANFFENCNINVTPHLDYWNKSSIIHSQINHCRLLNAMPWKLVAFEVHHLRFTDANTR